MWGAKPGRGVFSVVIPTLNEGDLLGMTVESVLDNTPLGQAEVVIVDDGSTDGSCVPFRAGVRGVRVVEGGGLGVAKARNRGAERAMGEFVVFLDAHCRVSPDWLSPLGAALRDRQVAMASPSFTRLSEPEPRGCGVGFTDDRLNTTWYEPLDALDTYDVPLGIGACQAFRADTFARLGRYEEGFTSWGSEDIEICLRAWLLGYRVLGVPRSVVAHLFREARNYEVEDQAVVENFLRMLFLHFSAPRIRRILRAIGEDSLIDAAMDAVMRSDVFRVRAELDAVRRRSDDWFFETFAAAAA